MIEKKKIFDLISVFFSSGVLLLSGIFTNLIVPKIMGVINYGYYKIFILYGAYIALAHLGIVDGVLLKYGGKRLNDDDLINIRSYFRILLYFSFCVALIMSIVAVCFFDNFIRWILLFLGIQVIISNAFYYLQYLTQALMNFKLFSFFNIIQALLNIGIVLVLYFSQKVKYLNTLSYKAYIPIYLSVYLVVLLGYAYKSNPFIFGKVKPFSKINKDIFMLIKIGLPVTISYQVATLIFNMDNQFISIFFSTVVFGLYSLAYSMVSMVTTILNTISSVLFPSLNRESTNEVIANYGKLTTYLLIIVYFMVTVYFPIELIVKIFLPKYIGALIYFKIVVPGVGISTCISLIIFNYFKILGKGHVYFIYGCFVLIIAIIINSLTYFITRSAIAIAGVSLFILFIWYMLTNGYLVMRYRVACKKNTCYLILMLMIFELTVLLLKNVTAFIFIYSVIYAVVTILFYKKELNELKAKFKSNWGRL